MTPGEPLCLTAGEALCLTPGATPLREDEQFGWHFLFCKKPSRATHSDVGSKDGYSIPKRKEADKLEFEQWPHLTQFKNWKTAFRREVITGSTYPRQATEWLAKIEQVKSMQHLDDVGSVFDRDKMSFVNLGFPKKGLVKIKTARVQEKNEVAKNTRTQESPDVDRKTDHLHDTLVPRSTTYKVESLARTTC